MFCAWSLGSDPLHPGRCVSTCMSPDKVAIMPCAKFRPVWLQNPISEYRNKYIFRYRKALACSIGGSRAELLELKVTAKTAFWC
jgi:hypothetical protein